MKKLIQKANILFYMLAISTAFLVVSCSDDFLDTSPTTFINDNDYAVSSAQNPELIDGVLNGIYTTLINQGTGGTTSDRDFGHKMMDIYGDILSNDMAYTRNTYNTYHTIANYTVTTDFTHIRNYIPWRYYYRVIRASNVFINSLGGNDLITSNEQINYGIGQAKALRAYAYFYLAQYYTTEYNSATKVLPLIIQPTSEAVAPSSNEDIYNQIILDLKDAITRLDGFQRGTQKNKINQTVAKILLSYTYGAMDTTESNEKAEILTNEVILDGQYPIMSSSEILGGFNDINTNSWIWGFDLTPDMNFGLGSWWGHVDLFTYSYQYGDVKAIDLNLYNSMPSDDARKGQFWVNPGHRWHLAPLNKFYDAERQVDGERLVTNDYVFMRMSEVYLLNAEMAAKTDNLPRAKTNLKAVVSQRVNDASYIDTLSKEDLLDEIYKQTRLELWGEGKSYLAMKRFKSTIVRGANHLYEAGSSVQYNDSKLTLEIPLSEVQNNSNF